jgi:hypothetical protein
VEDAPVAYGNYSRESQPSWLPPGHGTTGQHLSIFIGEVEVEPFGNRVENFAEMNLVRGFLDTLNGVLRVAIQIPDPEIRESALEGLDRQSRRWKGEIVPGDHQGDTIWQIMQNVASAHGIDISDENSLLVKKLRIAARDDDFGRVLKTCDRIVVTIGSIGPTARFIQSVFATTMAAHKVVHCSLHDFHLEGTELDEAFRAFKKQHCDSCPDRKPRPRTWTYSDVEKAQYENDNRSFLRSLDGTAFAPHPTESD